MPYQVTPNKEGFKVHSTTSGKTFQWHSKNRAKLDNYLRIREGFWAKRKTAVKSYIRKGKLVRQHKRAVYTISKTERPVFSKLTNLPFEVGGQMDFEKGKLEHAKMHIGEGTSVEWEYDPDYEVSYHTHPNLKGVSIMPSYDDIIGMKAGKEKAQVIFIGDYALSVAESDKFNKVSTKQIKELSKKLESDFKSGMSDVQLYAKYKNQFKDKLGLNIEVHKPNTDIKMKVK